MASNSGEPFRKIKDRARFLLEDFTELDLLMLVRLLLTISPQFVSGVIADYYESQIEMRKRLQGPSTEVAVQGPDDADFSNEDFAKVVNDLGARVQAVLFEALVK